MRSLEQASIGADGAATVTGDERESSSEPSRIGRYELGRRLGAGGGGIVRIARDPDLDREIALKLIRLDYLGGRGGSRLVREARVLAQLSHPNVVTVLGSTSGGG